MSMSKMIITRGLPASGKTFWATEWVNKAVHCRARVNRDDIRSMLHDGTFIQGVTESHVIAVRDNIIKSLLRRGVDVVVDETALKRRTVRDLMKLGQEAGAEVEIKDFTDISLDECVQRDALRGLNGERSVGDNVITDMYDRYLKGKEYPLPVPVLEGPETASDLLTPYTPPEGAPTAILVDVDGTVALHTGRSPYDYSRVTEDLPNEPVIRVIQQLLWNDVVDDVIFVSGRPETCREATKQWLDWFVVGMPAERELFMRAEDDDRADWIIKAELFNKHIRNQYNVLCVFDDRNRVVEMWRKLGLTCLQVAEGAF